ncbi:hypothetical protein [Roseburia sp. 1XD42-69]|uniref:hypothetical protein n=1 Tax=Roseburia sp. 1XD42-69 TaxID=2320088 RepID=UPI000EA17AE4|nr:hypothetical protein [Roseburia sp. 1XD42-69]RKJ64901.1 hypothetical protein D7Y06_11435 [Roseburia sp. 1XD42-69]
MNSKNIKRHLKAKLKDWVKHIDDEAVKKTIEENTIITGGALVSLLTGETVHDYDVYFRTKDACIEVAKYYVDKWNKKHEDKPVSLLWGERLAQETGEDNGAVKCFIKSKGIADEDEQADSSIAYNFESTAEEEESDAASDEGEKERYRPRFITSNAITLSDKIQIVTRFYGEVADIHKNYDFAHCTCAWSSWDNEVFLPVKALECIINKELYYVGSKYPLCSIIRTKKYIKRGYSINAGQYVKMCMQLNEVDLKDVKVLEEQLTGVDTTYFQMMIDELQKHKEESGCGSVDITYAMELINKLF